MTSAAEDRSVALATALTHQVFLRLGPASPPVSIARVGYYHGFDDESFTVILSPEPSENILIEVRIGDPENIQGVYFTVVAPREEAVAATATHIQDHVLEYTHGEPLPPCPRHRHPLQASVVDGVASWVCPQDHEHHVEPILPEDAG